MNTPHIKLENNARIAESILLPGDPLRAKFIAENFLENAQRFNSVRNMFGYTGEYKGKLVSVMGTGMGMPSMALYSYELIKFFDVKRLIRIGTCGAMQKNMNLYDVVLAMGAATDSNYASQYNLPGTLPAIASFNLLKDVEATCEKHAQTSHVGNVLSSDFFYNADADALKKWMDLNVLAVDMETAALYWNAIYLGVEALSIMTVSDHIITGEKTTPEERQTSFTKMMDIALEVATR